MERIKKVLLALGALVSSTLLVKYFIMPELWWTFLIPVLIIGFLLRNKIRYSFYVGFLSGFVAYFLLLILVKNNGIDLTRISTLLFGTTTVTKLVTCIIGGLLTAVAFYTGKHLPISRKS